MIEVKEIKDKFYFYRKDKIITTPNNSMLVVKNKNHAKSILDALKKPKNNNNSSSILNLTFFSCNLDEKEKILIINKILEILRCDSILYRCFNDKKLLDLMNKNLNFHINKFSKKFNTKIKFLDTILSTFNEENHNFREFLKKIDKFRLTVLYKSGMHTKSSILSYFFMNGEIDYKALYKLSNLEYIYQQRVWGKIDEHKIIEKDSKIILKNLSFFLNNLD